MHSLLRRKATDCFNPTVTQSGQLAGASGLCFVSVFYLPLKSETIDTFMKRSRRLKNNLLKEVLLPFWIVAMIRELCITVGATSGLKSQKAMHLHPD